jgi:hypothetical protein
LAELELELGRERRTAARDARRARGQPIGRPKALDASKATLAQRMHASGESASAYRCDAGGESGNRLPTAGLLVDAHRVVTNATDQSLCQCTSRRRDVRDRLAHRRRRAWSQLMSSGP